jgi:predicted RNase H-like HicB family nuclease
MKLTAVFEPAKEGGYTCFIEEIPAAISEGDTLKEAKANLLDALKLVLEYQRDQVRKSLSPKLFAKRLSLPMHEAQGAGAAHGERTVACSVAKADDTRFG